MRKLAFWVLFIGIFSCNVHAAEFPDALGLAVVNLPPDGANAAMGNCWVATPNFGSNSPAVTAMYGSKFSVSGSYTLVGFKRGPDVSVYQGSIFTRLPGDSTFQLSYADGGSNSYTDGAWEDGSFYSNTVEFKSLPNIDVQWGLKAVENLFIDGDKLYFGLGYLYSKAELHVQSITASPATSWESILISKSEGHAASVGLTYQPIKKFTVGGFYRHGWDKAEDEIASLDGSFSEKAKSHSQSDQFRLGASMQVTSLTMLALEYQHARFYDHAGKAKFDQIFAGIEQGIMKDFPLYLYGGWAADGPTAGIGFYLENGGFNLAYMKKPFRDLDPYFGEAGVFMASAYVNF